MNSKFILLLSSVILGFVVYHVINTHKVEVVNICAWYGIFSPDILRQFEQESGIKVVLDTFENNDILEAKIISGNSNYDIVTPSFIPYAARQTAIGAYEKINYQLIPNIKEIEGIITEKFKNNKGNMKYIIPYFWGTMGIIYNSKVINKLFPDLQQITYNELLNEKYMSAFSKYGIAFPEEYTDIFPQLIALFNTTGIKEIEKKIIPIKKYITKFNSSTTIYDLVSGNLCISICSSDFAYKIKKDSKGKIIYSIPANTTPMWIDCLAIPRQAIHKKNAYAFINFILRPEIAAKISNCTGILTTVKKSFFYISKSITDDHSICPNDDRIISSFIMGKPVTSLQEQEYARKATKTWAKIKIS